MALNDNLQMLFPVNVDNASLTCAPSAVSTLPASDMLNSKRNKFARIMGNTVTITLNALELNVISGVALPWHSLEPDATIQIRLFDEINSAGAVSYDSGVLPVGIVKPWGEFVPGIDPWGSAKWESSDTFPPVFYHSFSQVVWHSIEITINAPSNTYIDLPLLMLGYVFSPSENFSIGGRFAWLDDGDDKVDGDMRRQFSISLDYTVDRESERLEVESLRARKSGVVLVCLYPSATGLKYLRNTAVMKREADFIRSRLRNTDHQQPLVYGEVV